MSLVYAYRGRNKTVDIVIKNADGDTITPGGNDKVRIAIEREGEAAKLAVTSGTPTANGSSITKGASSRVRLDASDLLFSPGVYTMRVDYFDYDDDEDWKMVDKQVFHLEAV